MTVVGALHHRSFAWLWTGQAISRLGDSIHRVALSWWVLQPTGSAAVLVLAGLAHPGIRNLD
jgi:hypothetical protein